jgi:hypothetical protein
MINLSGLNLDAPVRQITARVAHYSGGTLAANYNYNDKLKSITVDRIGENNKFFGYGICQKLTLKLMDTERAVSISAGDTLKIYFISNDMAISSSLLPTFEVTEVHRDENTNELSITAYDYLKRADKLFINDISITSNGYKIKNFSYYAALALGFNKGSRWINAYLNINTKKYENGANFEGTETIREALNAIAEATQTIYYATEEDIVFKRLDVDGEPVLTISKEDYITLDSKTNRRLTTIVHATELGDNISVTTGAIGSTQFVRNNPFWELREDINELLEMAIAAIGGLTINQFSCNWRGNYLLEIGDKIALINKENEPVISYMLNDTLTYNGAFSQQTSWSYTDDETESASNPVNLGEALKQTFAKVDKVNKQIDIVASETSANTDAIAALQINTDSINASVMRVEEATESALESTKEELTQLTNKVNAQMTAEEVILQIESEIAKGATKVTTTTGFSFNENGLNVSKSGSEMATQITEDGMTVYKNNAAVLTANNIGVEAVNLQAKTYLTIGSYSRLEDYNSRTGCFWIGG